MRPLAIDEVVGFDLPLAPTANRVQGDARVLREQAPSVYALRFERLAAADAELVSSFVSDRVAPPGASSSSRSA